MKKDTLVVTYILILLEVILKENDWVIPDTNMDDVRDNEIAGNVLDGDSNIGHGSKGSIDSSSVKRKRKRRCKSHKSAKHRSQKEKTHKIANPENQNSENEELSDDGAVVMAVDNAGAEEVIDKIMDAKNDNVSIEEFIEDLPIQDELEEEFWLNNMDLDDEEEEDIWKVPGDELFLELDYLMKCLDNHLRKKNEKEDLPIEMHAAINLLLLLLQKSNASLNLYNQIWKWIECYYVRSQKMPKPPSHDSVLNYLSDQYDLECMKPHQKYCQLPTTNLQFPLIKHQFLVSVFSLLTDDSLTRPENLIFKDATQANRVLWIQWCLQWSW